MADEWDRERRFLLTMLKLFIALGIWVAVIILSLSLTSYGVALVLAMATFFVLVMGWALRGTPFDIYGPTADETLQRRGGWRERMESSVALVFVVSFLLAFRTNGAAQVACVAAAVATGTATVALLIRRHGIRSKS